MTARRRGAPRRSLAEWSIRVGLALVGVLLGYVSVSQTYAYCIRNKNPARAHMLAPGDGRISGAFAQKITELDTTEAGFARAEGIARLALAQDPTAVMAASTLGIAVQLRGENARAHRLFDYAERLSRRDLRTQLWAIEDAVVRGDVDGALRHYDIALRGSRSASVLLFPTLASAIEDSNIRTSLVKIFAAKPVWGPLFIEYVSGKGPDPKAASQLFQGLRKIGVPISEISQLLLVDALASRNLFDDAWIYYASIHPGLDRRRSRDADFGADLANPTLFDWHIRGTEGVSASFQRLDKGGVLNFDAPTSIGGPVVEQVQMLPPGSYRIVGHSANIDQEQVARPYWMLSCRAGRELGRVEIPNSAQENGNFSGSFSVPADCPVQNLTLVIRPSDAVSGVSGQIDHVQLSPLQ